MAESPEDLAKKMDEEFDAYLNTLGGKEYKDGWSEDNWEKEMEQHPAFVTNMNFENGEVPPLIEAFQQLKFGAEDNTPKELAENYKEEGNRHFKLQKYRFAVSSYTEGLKQKCEDDEMNAVLLANRAAAQFRLGNYRSAIVDCGRAVKLSPGHAKATRRGLDACLKLQKWDEALGWLHRIRTLQPENEEEFQKIERQITVAKKTKARDERKAALSNQKIDAAAQRLQNEIAKRDIKFSTGRKDAGPMRSVILNPDNSLSWPALFIYPEPSVTELVEAFHEDSMLKEHLMEMFLEKPDWDVDNKYSWETVNVYFEVFDTGKDELVRVPKRKHLHEILAHPKYKIKDGTATFVVFAQNTDSEKFFLSKCIVHDW